jgi:hypothetical protein
VRASDSIHYDNTSLSTSTKLVIEQHYTNYYLYVIKFHDVPRRCCRRSLKRSKLHQPCKYDYDDTTQSSTPTRRTTQAGMANILAMLYRLMDRRGPHANATYIYTNTMHGEVKQRLTTMIKAA